VYGVVFEEYIYGTCVLHATIIYLIQILKRTISFTFHLMKIISKGQLEDQISKKFIQFEREFLGRGPVNVKTDIIRDMILITLQGVLTKAEIELAKDLDGILMVKSMRSKLLENGKHYVAKMVFEVTGSNIVSLHTDISTRSGERVILIKIDKVLFG